MFYRSAFRKSLLFSALSLLLSAPTAWSDVGTSPLPSANTSVVQPSGNTGAAGTGIAIDVPAGRRGIQPSLALTYSSSARNGWLGVGWTLDMGSIQKADASSYVVTSNGSSSKLVSRGDWGTGYYGAKIEGGFSKYYLNSTTNGWEVTAKDGTKYYYGTTAASRQDGTYGTARWWLDKVVDTNGNYMTITYWKDQGEIYPDRIDYTGNGSLAPINYVKFYRESRSDAPTIYTVDTGVKTAYRLKTVEVVANGQRVRAYKLTYSSSASTWRSLLANVQQYGSDTVLDASGTITGGTAFPATTLGWQGNGIGSWAYYSTVSNVTVASGDFNGDGRTDLVTKTVDGETVSYWILYSSGNGTWNTVAFPWTTNGSSPLLSGDFNGDGRADLLVGSSIYVSTGTGTWSYFTGYISNAAAAGDFNGDGKTDLVTKTVDSGSGWVSYWIQFSNGSGGWTTVAFPWGTDGSVSAFTGDFNGDGMADLVLGIAGYQWSSIYLSKGNGTWASYTTVFSVVASGDFNGDGLTDLVTKTVDSGSGWISYSVLYSKGNGTWTTIAFPWGIDGMSQGNPQTLAADFNGDARADFFLGNYVYTASSLFPDILLSISNGLGGSTSLTYSLSTAYTNTFLPFVVQTVSSITVNDGNGNVSTTSYTYSGGLYDATEKEFRGFSYVKSTDPSSHTTETWFKQDAVYKGLPYDQIFKSSSGSTYTRTVNTYQSTTPYAGVTFPYLYQRDDYIYDTYTTPKRIYSVFTYDGYGNITRKDNYGDAAVTGDERYEFTDYTPTSEQATAWLVALPKESYVSTDSAGNNKVSKVTFGYSPDTKGNLLTKTAWLNGGASLVITYTYDAYGNRLTVKDARNYTSTIAYDTVTQTYPVSITNALGHAASKTWDYRFGKPLTETDPNGNASSYTYDVFGRVITARGPLDAGSTYGTVTYYYQNFGTVGSQRVTAYRTEQNGTSNAIWEETYFDGLGRTIKSRREGPDNKVIVTDLKYNRRGLMTQRSLPYFEGQTVYKVYLDYDPLGRLVKTTNPDGTVTSQSYNRGRVSFRDANDYKKVEEKDAYGRLVKVEEYKYAGDAAMLWTTTTYQYDAMGNLLKTIDVKGNQTVMAYDTLGRKTAMTDPDMGAWSYTYDANGNLITQTDAKNQTITFTYDALNRVTKKDYPTGTDAVYTYDEVTSTNGKGRLTTLTDAAGTTKYWFDAMGRTTKSTRTIDGTAYTTETTYDALSRITSVKYPDNETVSYNYDTGGNLSQITGYGTYGNYNALGQAGTITYPNGVTTTYQYISANSRLYSITTATATQGLMNTSYSYDNVGNILGITDYLDANRNQTFTYDHLNRLTQAVSTAYGTLTYAYSMIGNMTAKEGISYTYPTSGNPRPHAVTATSDGKSYVYDNNGNMTTDGLRTIAYDYDNMPSSVTMGAVTTSFAYDASGQRVKKITPTVTTVYVSKVYECVGGSCTKYIMAGGNKVAWKNSAGTFYYHQDHLGSSRVITDASGTKAEEITYLPYGATLTDIGNGTVSVEHRFTSQEFDAETGLYYYNARYYNPALGRFISADTIVPNPADPQSLNRYSYCRNNPIVYVDPTGHKFKLGSFLKAVVSGVVGGAVFVMSGGTASPVVAGMWAGMAAGATSAALNGGNIAVGAIGGAVMGSVGGVAYASYGATGAYSMMAAGAGYSGARGGAEGLAYYAGGVAGGYIGYSGAQYAMNSSSGAPASKQYAEAYTSDAGTLTDQNEINELARVTYAEGAGQYKVNNAMEGIAWTVRNRVETQGWPDTYYGVIHQRLQFSSVGGPLWNEAGNPSSLSGGAAAAYSRALTVATGVYNGTIPDPTRGALFFHSGTITSLPPRSAAFFGTLTRTEKIPPFYFYK